MECLPGGVCLGVSAQEGVFACWRVFAWGCLPGVSARRGMSAGGVSECLPDGVWQNTL